MAHPAVRRALERDAKIFLSVLVIEAILSLLVSLALAIGYLSALFWVVLATALAIMAVSAIEGSSAPERRLAQGMVYNVPRSYRETLAKGRTADGQERFWFMIVGFLWGVAFLAVAGLLALVKGS